MTTDGYATHLQVLEKLFLKNTFKTVLEFGCGKYSTTFFLKNCEKVVSVEEQEESWYNTVKEEFKNNINHKLFLNLSDIDGEYINDYYDLIFVDGRANRRVLNIHKMYDKTNIFVLHDTETNYYKWDSLNIKENWKLVYFNTPYFVDHKKVIIGTSILYNVNSKIIIPETF